jgi:hypothetical protein
MSDALALERSYKLIFAKTGKPKELRRHARKVFKRQDVAVIVPEVMVKITSFSTRGRSIREHANYICRNGKNPVYDSSDTLLNPGGANDRKAITAHVEAVEAADPAIRKNARLTMNMVLSMPPNTESGAFRDSVRTFLADHFDNHDYLYTFHTDTVCEHAHVFVPMLGHDGQRINPRKDDIARWREGFADRLERNGILANATPAPSRNQKTQREPKRWEPSPIDERVGYGATVNLSTEAHVKVIAAWRIIQQDFADREDHAMAKSIGDFVQAHFGVTERDRASQVLEDYSR